MKKKKIPIKKYCTICNDIIIGNPLYLNGVTCEICFWEVKLKEVEPNLNNLLKRKEYSIYKHKEAEREISYVKNLIRQHINNRSILSKIFYSIVEELIWRPGNLTIHRLTNQKIKAVLELRKTSSELQQISSDIQEIYSYRKKLDLLRSQKSKSLENQRKKERRKGIFFDKSNRKLDSNYNREKFNIRNKDYRRGNSLDNIIRNRFLSVALSAFNHECLSCKTKLNLTLDHFGIPKNMGGNFVLSHTKNTGLQMNLVVLCRSCNSSKGERSFLEYFDENQLLQAMSYQDSMMKELQKNNEILRIIKRWYGYKINDI